MQEKGQINLLNVMHIWLSLYGTLSFLKLVVCVSFNLSECIRFNGFCVFKCAITRATAMNGIAAQDVCIIAGDSLFYREFDLSQAISCYWETR